MSKERSLINPYEQEVKEYLHQNYPPKKSWVEKNLELLKSFRKRQNPMSDTEIIRDAIRITRDFAEQSGVNTTNRNETDVLHIPSRLEAIRKFRKGRPLFLDT